MPSARHELLVDLFREDPKQVAKLLAEILDIPVPPEAKPALHSQSFSHVKPSPHGADLVVRLATGSHNHLGVITEVQLDRDDDKFIAWPLYSVGLYSQLKAPVCVLVLAPDRPIAEWARKTINIGPGFVFNALVIGPGQIPPIVDQELAEQAVGLAVFSALAHAKDMDKALVARTAHVATKAARKLGDRLFVTCYNVLREALDNEALAKLEELMRLDIEPRNLSTEFGRKHVTAGMLQGLTSAIIDVLDARGIETTEDERQRIAQCEDLDTLHAWVRRAATVESASELFI